MKIRSACLALLLLLGACSDDDPTDQPGSPDGAGLANPASVFCIEQGGSLEIVSDAEGNQSGMCTLVDGTVVEEWEYYRRFHE
jgi:putative hemolysin